MSLFKRLISKLYHKYVCRPQTVDITNLNDYLLYCEEVYKLSGEYQLDTFEKLNAFYNIVYSNFKIKKTVKGLIEKGLDKPIVLGDKEYVNKFNQIFDEMKNKLK